MHTSYPKPRPRILDTRDTQRDDERERRLVFAEVDARDQKRCVCCGRRGNPASLTAIGKIHRAHIRDASLQGSLTAKNLVSLCWICHALEHAKRLHIVGTNANRALRFELDPEAVLAIFGTRLLPAHVRHSVR